MSKSLFVTTFDKKTKVCGGPSLPLHTTDRKAAKAMFGGSPDCETSNTMIFHPASGPSLCVSWIRFSV